MLRTLQAWLNGTRDYKVGVALFKCLDGDSALIKNFNEGYSLNNNWRLQEEMKKICEHLKAQENGNSNIDKPTTNTETSQNKKQIQRDRIIKISNTIINTAEKICKTVTNANPGLHEAVRNKAINVYKICMNKRAVLMSMVPADQYTNVNTPDLVASRKELSFEVCQLYNEASQLFEDADYVKIHGKLPGAQTNETAAEGDPVADIPDHAVKSALDNLRKNVRKMEKRPETPERLALLQAHYITLEKLETRWSSLKHIPSH